MSTDDNNANAVSPPAFVNIVSAQSSGEPIPANLEASQNPRSNPLDNPMIVEEILGHCDFDDLKHCRFISSSWFDLTMGAWRDKAVLRVAGSPTPNCAQWSDVRRIMENTPAQKQPKNYWFTLGALTTENVLQPDPMFCVGEMSTSLKYLVWSVNSTYSFFASLIFPRLHCLEHLILRLEEIPGAFTESVGVSVGNYREHGNLRALEIFGQIGSGFPWCRFLPLVPELKVFKADPRLKSGVVVRGEREIRSREWLFGFLQTAVDINSERIFPDKLVGLEELEIRGLHEIPQIDGTRLMSRILRCHFPLRRLKLEFGFRGTIAGLKSLLGSVARTLRYLDISFHENNVGNMVFRPISVDELWNAPIQLTNLIEANISSPCERGLVLLGALRFRQVGKLALKLSQNGEKKLNLLDGKLRLDSILNMHQMNFLEEFELSLIGKHELTPNSTTIEVMAKVMPNLKFLTMTMGSIAFQTVCVYWPELWILTIHETKDQRFGQIDDNIITGSNTPVRIGGFRQPNITDLKKLIKLEVVPNPDVPPKFTDRAGLYGFLQMPKLCNLTATFQTLSDATKKALEAKLKVTSLTIGATNYRNVQGQS